MPRYYFRIRDELGEATDEEGAELPDLAAARAHAIAGARSLMCDSLKRGVLNLAATIAIEDDDGETLALLRFDEAVDVRN